MKACVSSTEMQRSCQHGPDGRDPYGRPPITSNNFPPITGRRVNSLEPRKIYVPSLKYSRPLSRLFDKIAVVGILTFRSIERGRRKEA